MKNRIFIIIGLLFFVVGCYEVFDPDVEDVEPFLVIEGYISTQPGTHYIFINNSKSYKERPYYDGVSEAIVKAEDSSGNAIFFNDLGNGTYKVDLGQDEVARIGETYVLKVLTSEGDIYISTPQTVVPAPDIKRVYCEYDTKEILVENTYGDFREVSSDGINVVIETDGILPSDNYYMYKYSAYEQHMSYITFGINGYYIYRHRRLSGKYLNVIHTSNADEYGDFQIKNDVLTFISTEDMTDYIPPIPDSFTFGSTRFKGLLFSLQQLSISPDVYSFYNDVEQLLAAEGHLFDPVIPKVKGNISCLSDSTKQVVGIFAATDVSRKIGHLLIRPVDRVYSGELDSMPELWLDTCSWERPESWVETPF